MCLPEEYPVGLLGYRENPNQETTALAGVAQWTKRWPVNHKVAGLIPSVGCMLVGQVPSGGGVHEGNHK